MTTAIEPGDTFNLWYAKWQKTNEIRQLLTPEEMKGLDGLNGPQTRQTDPRSLPSDVYLRWYEYTLQIQAVPDEIVHRCAKAYCARVPGQDLETVKKRMCDNAQTFEAEFAHCPVVVMLHELLALEEELLYITKMRNLKGRCEELGVDVHIRAPEGPDLGASLLDLVPHPFWEYMAKTAGIPRSMQCLTQESKISMSLPREDYSPQRSTGLSVLERYLKWRDLADLLFPSPKKSGAEKISEYTRVARVFGPFDPVLEGESCAAQRRSFHQLHKDLYMNDIFQLNRTWFPRHVMTLDVDSRYTSLCKIRDDLYHEREQAMQVAYPQLKSGPKPTQHKVNSPRRAAKKRAPTRKGRKSALDLDAASATSILEASAPAFNSSADLAYLPQLDANSRHGSPASNEALIDAFGTACRIAGPEGAHPGETSKSSGSTRGTLVDLTSSSMGYDDADEWINQGQTSLSWMSAADQIDSAILDSRVSTRRPARSKTKARA
ncbi:hypothetical protein IAU60_006922 [Kwoniella sp. DSM 27419]